jgi:copper chaperone
METIRINVEGMSCQHCVHAITQSVESLSGVSSVEVDLESKIVYVTKEGTSLFQIKEAIEDQGFDVVD